MSSVISVWIVTIATDLAIFHPKKRKKGAGGTKTLPIDPRQPRRAQNVLSELGVPVKETTCI